MKVYDCFTFFNELDLLELRMEYLNDVVDYFVIVESEKTFSNQDKPFYYEENKERFKKWESKIINVHVAPVTEGFDFTKPTTYNPTSGFFLIEEQQRNGISAITEFIEDNDILLVGDIDELPYKGIVENLKNSNNFGLSKLALNMSFYYYYFNYKMEGLDNRWNGTVVVTGEYFKDNSPQEIRNERNHVYVLQSAGHHFSYLGGAKKVKEKIQSFAHQEFNNDDITDDKNIEQALAEGKDVLKRPGIVLRKIRMENFNDELRILMEKYPHFIKQ